MSDLVSNLVLPKLSDLEVFVLAPSPPDCDELIESLHQQLWKTAPRSERSPGDRVKCGDEIECTVVTVVNGIVVPGTPVKSSRFEVREFVHLPGFKEQLEQMTTFSASTFDLKLPTNYPVPTYSDQTATFYVEVQRAFEVHMPNLDDPEALSEAGLGASIEEALKSVAALKDDEQGQELLQAGLTGALETLVEEIDLELPEELVERELHRLWESSDGAVLKELEFSEGELALARETFARDPRFRTEVVERLTLGLGLAKLIEQENLTLNPEQVEVFLNDVLDQAGLAVEAAVEELRRDSTLVEVTARTALARVASEHLMSQVKITVLEP